MTLAACLDRRRNTAGEETEAPLRATLVRGDAIIGDDPFQRPQA